MDHAEQPEGTPAPYEAPEVPEAPDKETMEQIRKRRLAKLGGSGSSAPDAASAEKKDETASTAGPSSSAALMAKAGDSSTEDENPAKRAALSGATGRPNITIRPASTRASGPSETPTPAPRPISRQGDSASPHPRTDESIEDYADRVLSNIFRITVDPNKTTEAKDERTLLPNLSSELADEGVPLKIPVERLDEAILEAATAYPRTKPLLDYLLPCWKRVNKLLKQLRGPAAATAQKEKVLREARRLCFSNCVFALTMPELFDREPNASHDTLVPYLLKEVDHEDGLCIDFIQEGIARMGEDESIEPLFTQAMVDISASLSTLSMNDPFKPHVNALLTYSRYPVLLNALAQHPLFQMAQSAPNIEKNTLLGPFFRISPLQPEVCASYFPGPRTLDKSRIESSHKALQMYWSNHLTDLRTIINAFIRASPAARNKVLDWFAYIMNVNHKRRAIQVDPREVASDGFMMNVTVVLDYLCEPFMDTTFSKVSRIDINYFRRNPRVDIKEETKLNADQTQSDAFYSKKVEGESNFITEIFFLTLAAHHYGSEATNTKMRNLDKDIKYYLKNIAMMEAERPKLANRPDQLRLLDETLDRHTKVLERAMSLRMAIEGVLLEEKMQSRSLQFMRYVTIWLLRVASQTDYTPDKPLKLPLPTTQPEAFQCLPEYALQDILDNFKFVFRYVPQIILSAVGDEMITLCLTFLESSEYVRNPYLKASLVTLLAHGTWPLYHLKKGVLGDLMTNTKFANDYLLHAVIKFYIECESTGAHTQFYDKFNTRFEIFQVIKCVWSNDVYQKQLTQSSKTDRSFFVRFVNLLMNDATFVLDESLSKFPKIHELQMRLRDHSLSQQDREKIEEELRTAEGQASSYMQLGNETVAMMKLFTATLSEAFTMPEIVQRLANMLDYNLDILTGPKSKQLKVENPEKYYFNPKTLLPELIDIYLNLGTSQAFVEAVAADGRSYKPETMSMTAYILRSKRLKDEPDIMAWETLSKKVEAAKEMLDRAEMDFDDAPAEFEDPIMGHLMVDPVILPSKHVVDRSTIVQHLLSDPKDPYTRQPMVIEDVIADTELKAKIETWKDERRRQAREERARAQDAPGEAMEIDG